MSICCRVLLVLALVMPAAAQQPASKKSTSSSSKSQTLTVDGVVSMVKAGLSDDIIIARLRKENKPFDLSSDDMIRLKQSNVSDAVLKVMLDPKAEISTPQAAPAMAQPVTSGMMAGSSSGATPANAEAQSGDPNDPMVPHDSGIYLYTKDRDGKPALVVLERASYQGAKSGGMFATAMTYGAKKAKTKAVLNGPHANIQAKEASPVFYFYFDDKPAGLGKTYFGSNAVSNPNQFALLKLDVKKASRETVIGTFSMWGSSSGSNSGSMIPFQAERIRTGLYKVSIDKLEAGEYCFASAGQTTSAGPYAATTGSQDIFDFGVSIE